MALMDYQEALVWTQAHFGTKQARVYAQTIASAFEELRQGPGIPGVKWRPELGAQIASLHIARNRFKGRHLVIFRVIPAGDDAVISVLRLLHDSMDLRRHQLSFDAE